mgnify:CR=1 FL=1
MSTEERVNEHVPVATGPSFDQFPMHIDSETLLCSQDCVQRILSNSEGLDIIINSSVAVDTL